jgi:hypothetical protein
LSGDADDAAVALLGLDPFAPSSPNLLIPLSGIIVPRGTQPPFFDGISQMRRCLPRPPTVCFSSIAGVSLHRRELRVGAKAHKQTFLTSQMAEA